MATPSVQSSGPAAPEPAVGSIFTWAIGTAVFLSCSHLGVFSLGYGDLAGSLMEGFPLVLLVAKLAATIFSYGRNSWAIFNPAPPDSASMT